MDFLHNVLKAFIPMFVAVDLIGVLPFFVSMTETMENNVRKKVIRQSVVTALALAVAFVFVGQALFAYMRIELYDFMIAGGAVLFLISSQDLLSSEKKPGVPDLMIGVVPLGTPLLAGPAVLATAIITIKPYGLAATLTSIFLNLLIAGIAFHFSRYIVKLLGANGSRAISKIMALILAAYGVMMIRSGILQIIAVKDHLM